MTVPRDHNGAREARESVVQQQKATLRDRMRQLRAAIPPAERVLHASAVEERLLRLPALKRARTVLVFSSFGSEVSTESISRHLAADGRRVLLPMVRGPEMAAGELRPEHGLVPTVLGPKEPGEAAAIEPREIELVIVPGLAFDRDGYRLGYGGGHYDRYLARLRREALRVGIGFSAQLVPRVPHGPADERVDLVVTDRETIVCRGR
jgi:5-formyltetrahydrofolate cyclo-ligase